MPIYEYECKFCSYKFELLQKITDPMPEICPKCGKKGGIHKLISEASFTLKGNGWYATDYKSSRKSKKEETENKISTTKTDNNKPKEETKK